MAGEANAWDCRLDALCMGPVDAHDGAIQAMRRVLDVARARRLRGEERGVYYDA